MVLAIGLLCGSTLACTGKSTGTKESFLKSADDYAAQGKLSLIRFGGRFSYAA